MLPAAPSQHRSSRPRTRNPDERSTRSEHGAARACARGVELLINHGTFLCRNGFRDRFVHNGIINCTTHTATVDWPAAVTALDAGELPYSGGEHRLLRIAAGLAAEIPAHLRDCLTGLDHDNIQGSSARYSTLLDHDPESRFLDHF
jgi:hypothetical protein